jgi:hypothetical protein
MGRGILLWLRGVLRDRSAILILALASTVSTAAFAETLSPEADTCKASGLIALKQSSPQVKDVEIDPDSAKIITPQGRPTMEDGPESGPHCQPEQATVSLSATARARRTDQ